MHPNATNLQDMSWSAEQPLSSSRCGRRARTPWSTAAPAGPHHPVPHALTHVGPSNVTEWVTSYMMLYPSPPPWGLPPSKYCMTVGQRTSRLALLQESVWKTSCKLQAILVLWKQLRVGVLDQGEQQQSNPANKIMRAKWIWDAFSPSAEKSLHWSLSRKCSLRCAHHSAYAGQRQRNA